MKLLLIFLTMFLYLTSYSQNLSLSNNDGLINNGDTLFVNATGNQPLEIHVYVTNNSSTDIDVKVKKIDIEVMTGAFNSFCWGQCFAPGVIESPQPITISAGSTNTNGFYADYNAYNNDGYTLVKYIFFNSNNPSDSTYLYIYFESWPMSNPLENTDIIISNIYPNPANNHIYINYNLPTNSNNPKIIITDYAGKIIDNIIINANQTSLYYNTNYLQSGIYILHIINDSYSESRRFSIIK